MSPRQSEHKLETEVKKQYMRGYEKPRDRKEYGRSDATPIEKKKHSEISEARDDQYA